MVGKKRHRLMGGGSGVGRESVREHCVGKTTWLGKVAC